MSQNLRRGSGPPFCFFLRAVLAYFLPGMGAIGELVRVFEDRGMSRNYNLGTRDMVSAGRIALDRAASRGELSFSTADTVADRWAQFAAYAKSTGVGRMERISPELATAYGQAVARRVERGELSPAYAQNLVSAVNTVLHQVRDDWRSISPTRDCAIPERCAIRDTPPVGIDREVTGRALDVLREAGYERAAAVAELARELGLRSKEAALLDASRALREAQQHGVITLSEGTKGGRERSVPMTDERQIEALSRAAAVQNGNRNLVPSEQTWAQFRGGELRDGRESLQEARISGYHDLRAAYACQRYEALTGLPGPVLGGLIQDRQVDREAREQISAELGHGRIDVVAEYIGGR